MIGNSPWRAVKNVLIGHERELTERGLFHKLSLVALLAWVGLGADGLSSSCYGPEEAYKVLLAHPPLAVFIAMMTAATVVIICVSYSQIIALFPTGGGGYVVASRLLSPTAGVVSGSALLIDYVLTIAISVASGMDALFSFLPASWLAWKLVAAVGGVLFLTVLNLRGVRESVLLLAPVFCPVSWSPMPPRCFMPLGRMPARWSRCPATPCGRCTARRRKSACSA